MQTFSSAGKDRSCVLRGRAKSESTACLVTSSALGDRGADADIGFGAVEPFLDIWLRLQTQPESAVIINAPRSDWCCTLLRRGCGYSVITPQLRRYKYNTTVLSTEVIRTFLIAASKKSR